MTIIVDADACPVKNEITRVASKHGVPLRLFADINHRIETEYGDVTIVDQGADSVDLALINASLAGDVIVTQDYGVASLAIGKGCKVITPSGKVLDGANIDQLMFERHIARRERQQGRRAGKIKKRTSKDNLFFEEQLEHLLLNK